MRPPRPWAIIPIPSSSSTWCKDPGCQDPRFHLAAVQRAPHSTSSKKLRSNPQVEATKRQTRVRHGCSTPIHHAPTPVHHIYKAIPGAPHFPKPDHTHTGERVGGVLLYFYRGRCRYTNVPPLSHSGVSANCTPHMMAPNIVQTFGAPTQPRTGIPRAPNGSNGPNWTEGTFRKPFRPPPTLSCQEATVSEYFGVHGASKPPLIASKQVKTYV